MKYIDLKCPALINFYCNRENGNLITVNDTVDLCDEVETNKILDKYNFEHTKGYTWTTDAFFRETPEKIEYFKNIQSLIIQFQSDQDF